jgi:hypothetical protein
VPAFGRVLDRHLPDVSTAWAAQATETRVSDGGRGVRRPTGDVAVTAGRA